MRGVAAPTRAVMATVSPMAGGGTVSANVSPHRHRSSPRRPSEDSRSAGWIVLSFVAVTAILVGAIVAVLSTRDINLDTRVLWSLPAPSGSTSSEANELAGVWLTDDTVVRATVLSLTAYNLETGRQRWRLPAPAGTSICQVSPDVVEDVGAVIFGATRGSGDMCDQLTAVDVSSGERRWTTSLKKAGETSTDVLDRLASVSLARDLVVAQDVVAIRGYATGDGRLRWSVDPTTSSPTGCLPFKSVVDGGRMVVLLDCQNRGNVSMIDTATGRVLWKRNTTPAEGAVEFLDPIGVTPVVLASRSSAEQRQMLVLDTKTGLLVRQIPASVGADSDLDFSTDGFGLNGRAHYPVVVHAGKLFAATEGAVAARQNEIVAVDLATGRVAWATATAPGTVETILERDGDDILTLNKGRLKRLSRLVRYDADTGKGTDGVTVPRAVINTQFAVRVFVQDDKIVILSLSAGNTQPLITVLGKKPHWWSGE